MSLQNIIPNGTTIITKMGKLEGIVTGVTVRGSNNDHIEYNISMFKNGEHKSIWVNDFEIKVKQDVNQPIGFNYNGI